MDLEEFILKAKQSEKIVLRNEFGNKQEYDVVSLSDSVKGIYVDNDYIALVINNRLVLNTRYNQDVYMTELFRNLGYELKDSQELDKILKQEEAVGMIYTYWDMMNKIYARIQADEVVKSLDNKLINRDLDVDYNENYDNIQLIGMGINNYVYMKIMENIDGYWNEQDVADYIDKGTVYLQNYSIDNFEYLKQETVDCAVAEYEALYNKYMNMTVLGLESIANECVSKEILRVLKRVNEIYCNDGNGNRELRYFRVDNSTKQGEKLCWFLDADERIPFDEIQTIQDKNKREIFNRNEELKYLYSSNIESAVTDLIKIVFKDFERYKDKDKIYGVSLGDMVYLTSGYFGVVTEDGVALNNGRIVDADVSEVCIMFNKNEMQRYAGLRHMQEFIMKQFDRERMDEIEK